MHPALILALCASALAGAAALGLPAMRGLSAPLAPPEGGLLARAYRADIAGHHVAGVADNLSGLTFSSATGTLFSVTNRPPQLVELDTAGTLLRLVPLQGLRDPEGITHVAGDVFLIADEGDQSLHRVTVGPGTAPIAAGPGSRIAAAPRAWHNMGIEGLSWDARHNRLFLAQEMLPMRVLVAEGFDATARPLPGPRPLAEWHPASLSSLVTLDLSSLTLHEPTGHLLLLSHLSAVVAEYDAGGRLVGRLDLTAGQAGLTEDIAQAEGLAVGPDGSLYVVGEPNLFHRFRPTR